MHLRVPSNTNAEKVAIFLANELDEIRGVIETILDCDPVCGTSWWVTSEGKQISDAQFACLVEALANFVTRHIGASDVHEDIEAAVLLDMVAQVERDVTRHTASVPCDVNPERIRLPHSLDAVQEIFHTLPRLWWEVLE